MRTFSRILALALCIAMVFTTAFASGVKVSFVDFQSGEDSVVARVNLRNDASDEELSGKLIVASYDADGTLISMGESPKTILSKGAETVLSASVADGGANYRAFVWNDSIDPDGVHAVKGATGKEDFVVDTGADDTLKSVNTVYTHKIDQADGILYTNFHGRTAPEDSTATGGRFTYKHYAANAASYHEVFYADPYVEGYDFFAFDAGKKNYNTYADGILKFEITKDAEIVILATNSELDFPGFELSEKAPADGENWAKTRYIDRKFADALKALGITTTYALAKEYTKDKRDAFYDTYIKEAYEAATDEAKAKFDENWEQVTAFGVVTEPGHYTAMYTSRVDVADGEDSAEVVIPCETTGGTTRNIVVLVKPYKNKEIKKACFAPLAASASISAAPALKGVEIDGAFVSIDKFTDNAYTYKLDATGDCILPVVKGIATDNAIYAVTEYAIASNGRTAEIKVTAKNLYTNEASAVYTVNVEIDTPTIPEDAYDIVNLNGTTIVDDTNVLKLKITNEGTPDTGCPIDEPVNLVSGKTYDQYIAYINEYYEYEEGDENYVVGTAIYPENAVVSTNNAFKFAKDFDIGGNMGAEGDRRIITAINLKYDFLKDLYRFNGSIALHQMGNNLGGWFTGGLYLSGDGKSGEYAINAKTDKLPAVPWFEATMKENGTVYVAAHAAIPVLEAKGYKLVSSDTEIFSGIDRGGDKTGSTPQPGPKYFYSKSFSKGEVVEIFNTANGQSGGHPATWFFSTGTLSNEIFTYGKKSSAAVATAYKSDVTDGILYKDLFADEYTASNTTGGRWVSDFHPLGSGQRIKSIEDPSLVGCEYFTFSINNRGKFGTFPGENLLEFNVDKDCEVIILTKDADGSAVFGDFKKKTDVPGLTGFFPQANFVETFKNIGLSTSDISMEMVEDFYSQSGLTFTQIYEKWLGDYFPGTSEEELLTIVNNASKKTTLKTELFADVNSVSAVSGNSGTHKYDVSYSKTFKAGDTVAIPDPTGKVGFDRPIVVVVKPKVNTTIKDHVSDFCIVHENGADTFILGPGANANVKATYSDRIVHNYTDAATEPAVASAYSINGQRTFGVTDEILGLENCYYLRFYNQTGADKIRANGDAYADWAGGSDKEDLAWMTFKVNRDCDIIIIPSHSTPNFVKSNGWYRSDLADYAFTLKRQANGTYQDYTSRSQKVMYVKSFKAGDTVTLYNANNGEHFNTYDMLPYFAIVRAK